MNFSGRSVRLASRVIEIDEVFEVRIVVGFSAGDSGDGSIWALFVDPLHESRGIGRALIDAALACGGRYYLPYQIHASREQLLAEAGLDADGIRTTLLARWPGLAAATPRVQAG